MKKFFPVLIFWFSFLVNAQEFSSSVTLSAALLLQSAGAVLSINNEKNHNNTLLSLSDNLSLSQIHVGRICMITGGTLFIMNHPRSLEWDMLLRQASHLGLTFFSLYAIKNLHHYKNMSPTTKNVLCAFAPFLASTVTSRPIILESLWDYLYKPLITK